MNTHMKARAVMAAIGAAGALGLYALAELAQLGIVSGRPFLALVTATASFFLTLLAMIGPLTLARAALGAAIIAAAVTGLVITAAFGFAEVEDFLDSGSAVCAAIVVALVPMPFWIAGQRAGWRDYQDLFAQSWGIVVRSFAALAFVGLVWAALFLSDGLLQIVGIDLIDRVIGLGPMPWLISGAAFGLGLAVVQELSDYVSPYLILRLLRLLVPVVFAVSTLFLIALPIRGVTAVFGTWSFALILLTMAGAVATLITTVVDQDDAQASQSPLLRQLARAMALLLPIMAGLGAWAVWLRVAQYGWTPERVVAAQIAGLGLGYGGLYAVAVLRGSDWMAKIRQANVTMALALLSLAALTLTPILSAERLSTQSLMTRLEDGRLPVADLEPDLLRRWGVAGAEALAALEARATEPGQEALAQRLAQEGGTEITDRPALLRAIAEAVPLQPETATATRDMYLSALDDTRLQFVLENCARSLPGGGAACVMVVADLNPGLPGEEAILAEYNRGGYVQLTGFQNDFALGPVMRDVLPVAGELPQFSEGEALIRAWQAAPPAAKPVIANQLSGPDGSGLMLAP